MKNNLNYIITSLLTILLSQPLPSLASYVYPSNGLRNNAINITPKLSADNPNTLIAWGFGNYSGGMYRPYYGGMMGGYPMNYGYNNMMYNNYGNRYMYPMNSYGFGSMYNGYNMGTTPFGTVNYRYNSW